MNDLLLASAVNRREIDLQYQTGTIGWYVALYPAFRLLRRYFYITQLLRHPHVSKTVVNYIHCLIKKEMLQLKYGSSNHFKYTIT